MTVFPIRPMKTLSIFVLLFLTQIGFASNLDNAKSFLNGLIDLAEHQRRHSNTATPEIRKKIKDLSAKIDFNSLAQKSMTTHWTKLSAQQKTDFLDTLQALLEEVAYPNAKKVSAHQEELKFVPQMGGQRVLVSGTLERPKKGEVVLTPFEIVLHYKLGKIVDATLEGELLSSNLKKQFDKAFQKQSFDEILTKMKNRVAAAKKPKPKSPQK